MNVRKSLTAALLGLTVLAFAGAGEAATPSPGRAASPEVLARDLVRRLNLQREAGWDTPGHRDTDPAFQRLMDDNGSLAFSHYGGVDLDYDPVCQCQDTGGRFTLVSLTRSSPILAVMHMRADSDLPTTEPPATYDIVLKLIAGRWRIYDVVERENGSLRQQLIRHNACLRASRNPAVIDRCFAGH